MRLRFDVPTLVLTATVLGYGVAVAALATTTAVAAPPAAIRVEAREVIARVNGENLYVEDVESVLEEVHKRSAEGSRGGFDLDQLLFRAINDTLLAQEARALGMDEDEAIVRKLVELRERMAKARLYQVEIIERMDVGPEQVRALYDDLFRRFSLHLLTRRDRGEAERLRERILGGEEIEALARAESQDAFAARGGKLERTTVLDLEPSVARTASALAPGEVSAVFATGSGWTVVRLDALEPADPEGFAAEERMTRAVARRDREQELRDELLARLGTEHPVEIDREAVAAIETQRMPDGRVMPKVASPERVVVRAAGRAITERELGSALAAQWGKLVNPEAALALTPIVLDRMIFDELVSAESVRRGYGATPEVDRAVHALEARLLVERYLREVIARGVEVDRATAEAYYAEHRDEFRRPPRLHVLQLTVADEAEAERLVELARRGADFAWLVRQSSTDAYRQSGGDRGWMPAHRGLDRFADLLREAQEGDVFGPRGVAGDWQVIKVDAVEDAGHYAFEEVSGNVRRRLVEVEQMKRLDATIQALRARSEIWINEEAIARLRLDVGLGRGGERGPNGAPGHSGP
jgi:parvulin-like peptidyl-prolyl isomerase